MQLLYQFYYKQFGVRRLQSLLSPRLFEFSSFPRSSMVHWLTNDPEHLTIDSTKLYFNGYSKRILVDYTEELVDNKGNPKRKSQLLKPLIQPWHFENKQFRYLKNAYTVVADPSTLIIQNYNFLQELYRYTELPLTPYYKWWNAQKTLWTTINNIAKDSDRNHFVFINIPETLPGFNFLRIYSNRVNITLLKVFDTADKLMLLEFWKWLGEDTRKDSALSALDQAALSKVNIVFINKENKSMLINLGYLNSWIKGSENVTEFSSVTQIQPLQMQKVFLKSMIMLQSTIVEEPTEAEVTEVHTDEEVLAKPGDDEEIDIAEQKEIEADAHEFETEHTLNEEDVIEDEYSDNQVNVSKQAKPTKQVFDIDLDNTPEVGLNFDIDKIINDIDEDIKVLDVVNVKQVMAQGIKINKDGDAEQLSHLQEEESFTKDEIVNMVYTDHTAYETIKVQLDDLAEVGALTASDYRKKLKDLEAYMTMKDPYGSNQTAISASTIQPQELIIDSDKTDIITSDLVTDISMKTSSLLSFDRDYVNTVMKKDTLAMIGSIQKAGIIVKGHEIEKDISALGSYENHTLTLSPIDGATSTIRIRIPKVNKEGNYIANGNKYNLRKQRVD